MFQGCGCNLLVMQRISEQEAQELIRGNRGSGRTSSRYTEGFWDQVFCGEPVLLLQDGRTKTVGRRDFDMKTTSFIGLVYKENARRRSIDPDHHGDYSVHRIKVGGQIMTDRILVRPRSSAS